MGKQINDNIMIDTLHNLFGNLPVIGEPIKMAYLGNRVKEAVQKTKDSKLDGDTANLAGNKLDEQLRNKADEIYSQHVAEHVQKAGLPEFANEKIKNKAIDSIVNVLVEKAKQQVTTKH